MGRLGCSLGDRNLKRFDFVSDLIVIRIKFLSSLHVRVGIFIEATDFFYECNINQRVQLVQLHSFFARLLCCNLQVVDALLVTTPVEAQQYTDVVIREEVFGIAG